MLTYMIAYKPFWMTELMKRRGIYTHLLHLLEEEKTTERRRRRGRAKKQHCYYSVETSKMVSTPCRAGNKCRETPKKGTHTHVRGSIKMNRMKIRDNNNNNNKAKKELKALILITTMKLIRTLTWTRWIRIVERITTIEWLCTETIVNMRWCWCSVFSVQRSIRWLHHQSFLSIVSFYNITLFPGFFLDGE